MSTLLQELKAVRAREKALAEGARKFVQAIETMRDANDEAGEALATKLWNEAYIELKPLVDGAPAQMRPTQ